ncbi:hypothetical protein EDB85DRAFT_1898048 [Lactarius pseudohatsudake]|nr:hypothetical protein EDB85DRAFT_1898048 [Lactarius pseudohatsudake]
MAAAQDLEHGEMVSNSNPLLQPRPLRIANFRKKSLDSTRIAESQGSLSRVEVTVLRAHNLPSIKKRRGLKRSFYVTITHDTTTKKTKSGRIDVLHNGLHISYYVFMRSGASTPMSSSERTKQQYPSKHKRLNIFGVEVPYVLTNHDEQSGQSNQQVTLYLKVVVSPAENALRDADGAMTSINLSNKWEGALVRIKWVVDTLGPVAEVHHDVLFFADP